MTYNCRVNDCCEGCAIGVSDLYGNARLCLVQLQVAGRVKLKHISCALFCIEYTSRWRQVRGIAHRSRLGILRHLSDTSQSTPDRTRYICTVCTLWLSLPIHVKRTAREARDGPGAACHETQSAVHTPRHPALAAVTSYCATPISVFEGLRIIFLLHCHGRSVFQQRVLSPLSSSIKPGRDISAARWLSPLTTLH